MKQNPLLARFGKEGILFVPLATLGRPDCYYNWCCSMNKDSKFEQNVIESKKVKEIV